MSIFENRGRSIGQIASHQVKGIARALRLVWWSAPGATAISLALLVVQGLLPLATLYLTKRIIDTVTAAGQGGEQAFRAVLPWILLALGAAILSSIARALADLAGQAQSYAVTDTVSDVLHAQSVAVDLGYYEDPAYFDTLHRAQQEAHYRPGHILNGLVQVLQNGISLVAVAALLFTLDWRLGLVLFIVAVPGAVVRFFDAHRRFQFEKAQTAAERRAWYYHWLQVDAEFAKELRLFHLGPFLQKRFRDIRQELRQGRMDLARRRAVVDLAVQVVAAAAVYGLMAYAALRAVSGTLTLGDLVAVYVGFQSGLGYFQSVLQGLAGLYEDNLFLSSFYQFLDLKPDIRAPEHPSPVPSPLRAGVRFERVSFTYPGSDRPALCEVDLDLAPGEVIALVGENGSGKTTLVKLLCQLYLPDAGSITADGIDLNRFDPVEWRREISVIFQDYARYNLKAWENIWLGATDRQPEMDRIIQAAREAGADAALRRLPQGYETQLGAWFEQGHELSTGEWQKMALARAFWRGSGIVVLDEPTSALDPLAEAEFFRHFRQLLGGRSAVIISHRFSTVGIADRVYVLGNGQVMERGSHAELLAREGQYARLFHAQAGLYRADREKA